MRPQAARSGSRGAPKGHRMTPTILTWPSNNENSDFARLKRKKRTKWRLLVSGEWSETPMNEGNVTVDISYSLDRKTWALLQRGVPNRIVAVAETDGTILEDIAAEMMAQLRF